MKKLYNTYINYAKKLFTPYARHNVALRIYYIHYPLLVNKQIMKTVFLAYLTTSFIILTISAWTDIVGKDLVTPCLFVLTFYCLTKKYDKNFYLIKKYEKN